MFEQAEAATRRPAKRLRPISEADEEADTDKIRGNQAFSIKANEPSVVEKELSRYFTENNIDIANCLKVFSSKSDTKIGLLKIENSSLREKLKRSRDSHDQDREELETFKVIYQSTKDNYQTTKKTLEDTQDRLIQAESQLKKTRELNMAIMKENQAQKNIVEVLLKERATIAEAWNSRFELIKEEFTNGPQRRIQELLEENVRLDGVIHELKIESVVTQAADSDNIELEDVASSEREKLLPEAEKEGCVNQEAVKGKDGLNWKGEEHRQRADIDDLMNDKERLAEEGRSSRLPSELQLQPSSSIISRTGIERDNINKQIQIDKAKLSELTTTIHRTNVARTALELVIVRLNETEDDLMMEVKRREEKLKYNEDKADGYYLHLAMCLGLAHR